MTRIKKRPQTAKSNRELGCGTIREHKPPHKQGKAFRGIKNNGKKESMRRPGEAAVADKEGPNKGREWATFMLGKCWMCGDGISGAKTRTSIARGRVLRRGE